MAESSSQTPSKKKRHVWRKLIGTIVVAGAATYAANILIRPRKNKKEPIKKK